MSIEAVIWDLGGVIVRTEDQTSRTKLAERLGTTNEGLVKEIWGSEDSRKATLGEIAERAYWDAAAARHGLSYEDFMHGFFDGDVADPELIAYIRGLRGRYKTALLSNAFSDLRGWITDTWKFQDAFDVMVISAEVNLMKPDPAIYAHVLKEVGVEAKAAVFIDDVLENIEAARAAGMHAIQFRSREQAIAELEKLLETA